jgi:hypothetical protein
MQKNVGTWDAIMRITLGLAGLAWSISRMTRRSNQGMPLLVALVSGMKVAEGITRFCPLLYTMGVSTKETAIKKTNVTGMGNNKQSKAGSSSDPFNPEDSTIY